jgi:hypothetical protein
MLEHVDHPLAGFLALTARSGLALASRQSQILGNTRFSLPGKNFTYILALSGVWTILLPAFIAAKFRRLKVTASTLLLLPIYYLLVSAATWAAMLDLTLRPHYWAKTAHGRSRQEPSLVVSRAQPST